MRFCIGIIDSAGKGLDPDPDLEAILTESGQTILTEDGFDLFA
jgi:hypothetical protein